MSATKLSFVETRSPYVKRVKLGRFLLGVVYSYHLSDDQLVWCAVQDGGSVVRDGLKLHNFPSQEAAGTYLANSPSVLEKRK